MIFLINNQQYCAGQILEQLQQSGKIRKIHHFTVTHPLKPGKETYAISQCNDI